MVGDSRQRENWVKLMGDQKGSISLSSPPYPEMRDYITWDHDFEGLVKRVYSIIGDFMVPDHQILVNFGNKIIKGRFIRYWNPWLDFMENEVGYRLYDEYMWDKLQHAPACNHRLGRAYERIFHLNKMKRLPHYTVQKKPESIANLKEAYQGRRAANGTRKNNVVLRPERLHPTMRLADNVFRVRRDYQAGIRNKHPAIYPTALVEAVIAPCTNIGDIVIEPFSGSGSTILGCHSSLRRCFAMEIEVQYAEWTISVWEDKTGIPARLISY
jgi:DNA modification methylase